MNAPAIKAGEILAGAMTLARMTVAYAAVSFFAGAAFFLLAVPASTWLGGTQDCGALDAHQAAGASFERQSAIARDRAQCLQSKAALSDRTPMTRGEYAQDSLLKTRDEMGILRYAVMGSLALGLLLAAFELTLKRQLPVLQGNLSRIRATINDEKRRRGL